MSAIVFPLFVLIFVLSGIEIWLAKRKRARTQAEIEKARERALMDGRDIWGFRTDTGGGATGGANAMSSFSIIVSGGGGGSLGHRAGRTGRRFQADSSRLGVAGLSMSRVPRHGEAAQNSP